MRYCFLKYIGSKHRMASAIVHRLQATGKDTLVEVFGGSGAVMLNSEFSKRIYNDIDGDLVNLFRVIAEPGMRRLLLKTLRWQPPSREIFDTDYSRYVAHGYSFSWMHDPVDRARATFYRSMFCFGGKMRSGGFQVSTHGRNQVKEIGKFQSNLRQLAKFGEYFRNTVIENLDFEKCIALYGSLRDTVLFIDPPYPDIQRYYSNEISEARHVFLAHQLRHCAAPVICTFYDCEIIRDLYSEKEWRYEFFDSIKNSSGRKFGMKKQTVQELILTKL